MASRIDCVPRGLAPRPHNPNPENSRRCARQGSNDRPFALWLTADHVTRFHRLDRDDDGGLVPLSPPPRLLPHWMSSTRHQPLFFVTLIP